MTSVNFFDPKLLSLSSLPSLIAIFILQSSATPSRHFHRPLSADSETARRSGLVVRRGLT